MDPEQPRDRSWRLNLRQRARILRGRQVVQVPAQPVDLRLVMAGSAGVRHEGIPVDVLMTLEALRQLAEQGNLAAKWLYDQQRVQLGIDRPSITGI